MILKNFFKFQEALAESMNDVKQKVTNTIDHMNSVVKRASEMGITMHNLIENRKNQDKIDNIFCESSLPFEDYEETDDEPRSNKLRKYIHVKTKEEFAFKTVNIRHVNEVKNQVTILK